MEYGSVPLFVNDTIPMCLLLCRKTFSKDSLKAAKIRDHSKTIHSGKKNKDFKYFKMPKQELRAQPNLNELFRSSVGADSELKD